MAESIVDMALDGGIVVLLPSASDFKVLGR